jgi:hypothetical protein
MEQMVVLTDLLARRQRPDRASSPRGDYISRYE